MNTHATLLTTLMLSLTACVGDALDLEPLGTGRRAKTDAGSTRADAGAVDAGADAGPQEPHDAGDGCARIPAGLSPTERWARERTESDQPDDEPGAYQVHVLYVEPSDRTASPALDLDGTLRRTVASMNGWLSLQTGGPALRFDTCHGTLDVTHVKLGSGLTELALATGDGLTPTGPVFQRDRLEAELKKTFTAPNKLYLVYFDGLAFAHCGGAPFPPLLHGHFPVLFVGGEFHTTFLTSAVDAGVTTLPVSNTSALPLPTPPFSATLDAEAVTVTAVSASTVTLSQPLQQPHGASSVLRGATTIPACRSNRFSSDGQAMAYWEMSGVHECLHTLGIVSSTAPDFAQAPIAPGHLNDTNPAGPADLMYQGAQNWRCSDTAANPALALCKLDPMHRNYFGLPNGATQVDLARSVFLTPTPSSAVVPEGW